MANTTGEKELKTDWPHEEGLTAGTTKTHGRRTHLVPEESSNVLKRDQVGI
jgi:hypothetical protein